MRIRLNKAHFPVTTLGPGRRIGLWLQGCSIRCSGCVSRDTWVADTKYEISLDDLLAWCRNTAPDGPDGVTISGGEPFEQPEALGALLARLHAWRQELAHPFDILAYSGLPLRRLLQKHAAIVAGLDALIPEPYRARLPQGRRWRGSANQPLVVLTSLGRTRYAALVDAEPEGRLQVTVDNGAVWMIGIPGPGDLERLEAATRERGVNLGGASWRA